MGLCGSFRCGCGVTSTPATDGLIDGEVPTIFVSGSGEAGDPYDLLLNGAWAQAIVDELTALDTDKIESVGGTYTPTVTGAVVGTGGSTDGLWRFVGGTAVGAIGLLNLDITLTFGSAGQTFPTATTFTLPPGFEAASPSSARPLGTARFTDANAGANSRVGTVFHGSPAASTVKGMIDTRAANVADLSTTTPFTWQASDTIQIHATITAIRV